MDKPGFRYYKKAYNIPTTVHYCKNCVVSNQRPRITFNSDGICSACQFSEKKNREFDWDQREKELQILCDKYRRSDGTNDVVVPSSGGKDSAFVAHLLKDKYGMNPLTVTWAPHKYTDIGFANFENHIHIGDLDNLKVTPKGQLHRKMTRCALDILGDPFLPFIYGQNNLPLRVAQKFNISLIFYGENSEVEYGGNMKDAYVPTRQWKTKNLQICMSGVSPEEFTNYGIESKDLYWYTSPTSAELDALNLEIHYMSYYKKWIPQSNYYYCTENTGFEPNPERSEGTYSKYASLDDQLDGFHYYLMFIKFGIGRATSDAAHEVRDGHITREEAVALVRRYDGEFPKKFYDYFLDYCQITSKQFEEIVDSWRPDHLWNHDDMKWVLASQVS
jgi:N-acetyl sugar amidotransferase